MAVDWAIGVGLAVVKVALRLQGEPDVADMVNDVASGSGVLVRGVRRPLGRKDLGELIASRVEDELPAWSRTRLKEDPETRAAAQIAADVVAGLAADSKALANALARPDNFLHYVRDHSGSMARQQMVAKHAETVYDQVLDAAARQLLVLAPTSKRAMSAGMAEALQQLTLARGSLDEIDRGVRGIDAGVDELLQYARHNASWTSGSSGYLSTSALRRALDIDSFQGRAWLIAELDEWINANDSGYIVIEGQGGVGKTALLLHLALTRGWPHHFIHEHGSDPAVVYANIAAQLPADPGAEDVWSESGGVDTAPNFYDLLASRAAARRASSESSLVLVIDALDEVAHAPGAMPVGLPTRLPPGVFAVLSRQPGTRGLPALNHVIQISTQDERNVADIRTAIAEFVIEPEIQKMLDEFGMDPRVLADTISQKVGGLWIYLKFLTDDIRARREPLNTVGDLPARLEEYFSRRLADDYFCGRKRWTKVSKPLLAALAAEHEPLTLQELCAISGTTGTNKARNLVQNAWRAFLDVRVDRDPPKVTYQLYHSTLIDWLTGRWPSEPRLSEPLGLLRIELHEASMATHRRVAAAYLRAFGLDDNDGPADDAVFPAGRDYGLRHLATHLVEADMTSNLHLLFQYQEVVGVTTNRWFELHQRAGTIRHFLESLGIARWHARALTLAEIDAGKPANSLALELRYMLIAALLRSRSANLTPELIVRFSQVPGRRAEATTMARQARPAARVAALVGIALSEPSDVELLIDALRDLPLINHGQYGKTSEAVLTAVAERASAAALPRVLDVLTSMTQDQQAQVICQLAARLGYVGLLNRGIEIARTFDYAAYRCDALARLAPNVADDTIREELLIEAIDALIATEWRNEGIAEGLALELPPVLLREAIGRLRALDPITANALCLQIAMVTRLPNPQERVYEESHLVQQAFELTDVEARCEALTHMASVLSSDQRRQALELAEGLQENGYTASRLLRALGPHLYPSERALALALAFELTDGDRARDAIEALAPHLTLPEASRAIREIAQIDRPLVRAYRALALAKHLPNPSAERTSALNIALRASTALEGYERAGVLVSATELTAGEEELFALAFRQAFTSVPEHLIRLAAIDAYDAHRADLLSIILDRISWTSSDHRSRELVREIVPLLDDALTVRAVNVFRSAVDRPIRSRRLIEAAEALAESTAELLGAKTITGLLAIASVLGGTDGTDGVKLSLLEGHVCEPYRSRYSKDLTRKCARADDLRRLAWLMSPDQLTAVLVRASASKAAGTMSPNEFVEIGLAAAPAATDGQVKEILATIEELADEPSRVSARISLLPFLESDAERRRLTDVALSELRDMTVYIGYVDLISDLAAHRPDVADEAISAIKDRVEGMFPMPSHMRCLDVVLDQLSDEQLGTWWVRSSKSKNPEFATALLRSAHVRIPKVLLDESLLDSANSGDGVIAQRILSVAARSVDKSIVDEFLDWIRPAVDAETYAEWLCALAGQVPEFIDDAAAACEAMTDPVRRSLAAAHAAASVSPEAVERFLAFVHRDQWAEEGFPISTDSDFDYWITTMLGRRLLTTWRYLDVAIGEPTFERLLDLLPQIVELAEPESGGDIVDAVARTLHECCIGNYWDET